MAIITVFSGSYCCGDEVVRQVIDRLNLDRLNEKLFSDVERRFGVSAEKLRNIIAGHTPLMNKITREREKSLAYLKAVIAEHIIQDDQLLHDLAGFLIPRSIAHVMRVCVIANFEYRVNCVMREEGKSEKEAHKIIHKDDMERGIWTKFLFEKPPYDESLFDIVVPMQDLSVSEAVEIICENAAKDAVAMTTDSRQAAMDFLLSASVNLALVEAGYDEEVTAVDGQVTVTINKYVLRLEQHQKKLKQISQEIDGVREVRTRIGSKYTPPSIIPSEKLSMPSKILLVDDEKEFVHTLSERLEARDLKSSIVYDGEQALESINQDEPDVMILDLKMPGIDGLEVLRRVKQEHPRVEVIILTGHGSEREELLAEELGAFAYLHKPVNIDVLTRTMKEAYRKLNIERSAELDDK